MEFAIGMDTAPTSPIHTVEGVVSGYAIAFDFISLSSTSARVEGGIARGVSCIDTVDRELSWLSALEVVLPRGCNCRGGARSKFMSGNALEKHCPDLRGPKSHKNSKWRG